MVKEKLDFTMKSLSKKEHLEHQKALKPLLKHLREDEKKLEKKSKKKK